MPEHPFDRPIDVCTAHRAIVRCQHLDDRSLDYAVAKASLLRLRSQPLLWLQRLIRQGLEYRPQGRRGV
jgi:hypothetical protein